MIRQRNASSECARRAPRHHDAETDEDVEAKAFTQDAKREARRDGARPIGLVDGAKLVDMFEKLEFGLKPRMVFEVDDAFFEEFRK